MAIAPAPVAGSGATQSSLGGTLIATLLSTLAGPRLLVKLAFQLAVLDSNSL